MRFSSLFIGYVAVGIFGPALFISVAMLLLCGIACATLPWFGVPLGVLIALVICIVLFIRAFRAAGRLGKPARGRAKLWLATSIFWLPILSYISANLTLGWIEYTLRLIQG